MGLYRHCELDKATPPEPKKTKILTSFSDSVFLDAIVSNSKVSKNLIPLPELSFPWIENIDLRTILKVRNDSEECLENFRRAYHKALLEHIKYCRSLDDFQKLSKQINEDIVIPEIVRIEKKYKRIIALHNSLIVSGAAVTMLPIVGVVIKGLLLNEILSNDLLAMIPSSITGLLATIASNKIGQHYSAKALEDDDFYIIWRITKTKHSK